MVRTSEVVRCTQQLWAPGAEASLPKTRRLAPLSWRPWLSGKVKAAGLSGGWEKPSYFNGLFVKIFDKSAYTNGIASSSAQSSSSPCQSLSWNSRSMRSTAAKSSGGPIACTNMASFAAIIDFNSM